MRAALTCLDKPDSLQIRLDHLSANLGYIAAPGLSEMTAPFLYPELLLTDRLRVVNVENLDADRHRAANDPYALAGLFSSVTITGWKKVIG